MKRQLVAWNASQAIYVAGTMNDTCIDRGAERKYILSCTSFDCLSTSQGLIAQRVITFKHIGDRQELHLQLVIIYSPCSSCTSEASSASTGEYCTQWRESAGQSAPVASPCRGHSDRAWCILLLPPLLSSRVLLPLLPQPPTFFSMYFSFVGTTHEVLAGTAALHHIAASGSRL